MTSFNEGSIHNPFACHVLVHIINIKIQQHTLEFNTSRIIHTYCQRPPLSLCFYLCLTCYLYLSLLSLLLYSTCLLCFHPWWLACKQFLLHVAVMKTASRGDGFVSGSDISICLEHGCWCFGKAWDVGLQPGHVSVSDWSTWPLMGICSVYLLADVYLGWIDLDGYICFSSGLEKVPCASCLAMRLTWIKVLSGLWWFKHLGWVIAFLWIWQQVEPFYVISNQHMVFCKYSTYCVSVLTPISVSLIQCISWYNCKNNRKYIVLCL